MPEDTKKNSQKGKNDPKEQRRRRGRQQTAPVEKKIEKEPIRNEVPKEPEKPAYEPPGPEFYQSLKRETDEILKITEEANTKYKKKEIQSNWAKYEMPIETYEEIDEQENLGADYEALIQASFSVGGHFQFKHEKSWDITTGPTPYDKYFDINMENLYLALSTIPFYERNDIDTSIFVENDISNMDHRATKFKHKYYNDKKYMTPDLEVQEKILKSLNSDNKFEINNGDEDIKSNDIYNENQNSLKEIKLEEYEPPNIVSGIVNHSVEDISSPDDMIVDKEREATNESVTIINETPKTTNNEILKPKNIVQPQIDENVVDSKMIDNDFDDLVKNIDAGDKNVNKVQSDITVSQAKDVPKAIDLPNEIKLPKAPKDSTTQREPPKNPVIESPEDLEKWLDDFLDG